MRQSGVWLAIGVVLACKPTFLEGKPRSDDGSKAQRARASADAAWDATILEDGSFRLSYDHVPVLSFDHVFWVGTWTWADVLLQPTELGPTQKAFSVRVPKAGLTGKLVLTANPGRLKVRFELEAAENLKVTGGGMEFQLDLRPDLFGPNVQGPKLKDAEPPGFEFETPAGALSATVSGGNPKLYFEQGDTSRLRVFLFHETIQPGTHEFKIDVRLPPGTRIQPSLKDAFGETDPSSWFFNSAPYDRSPVDLRHLGPMPDKGGLPRVRAQGDDLVLPDGRPIRFFGTNIAAYTLFTSPREEVVRQARRMAAMGINLVRIHHHDSPWVNPNIFGQDPKTTRKIDPDSMRQIDGWIQALNQNGIYVWLDLHVGRSFEKGDGIDAFGELRDGTDEAKGLSFVNESVEARLHEFATAYLSHENQFTGRKLGEDPGVLAVLVTNENDLVFHFGNHFLPENGHPKHRDMFLKKASDIIEAKGLPRGQALRTWEPGPAKVLLSQLERQFFERHDRALASVGLKSLVVRGHAWGTTPLYVLPALEGGDMIDVHSYGEAESLFVNPRFVPNFIHWIGAFQTLGKPLSISEWNVPWPAPDRFVTPLYLAAVSAFQGWDAPMLYAWTHRRLEATGSADPWIVLDDPAMAATIPAASILLREGHVQQGKDLHVVVMDDHALFHRQTSPKTSRTLRTLVERSRVAVKLPHQDRPVPKGAVVVKDLDRDFIPPGRNQVESDTGELRRNWEKGVFTIDTERTQAAMGGIGTEEIHLKDVSIRSVHRFGTLAFTSMDARPISKSEKILVTAVARATDRKGRLPFRAEPVKAEFAIRHERKLRLVPLKPGGQPMKARGPRGPADEETPNPEASGKGGSNPSKASSTSPQVFEIAGDIPTHWFILEPAESR